MALCAGGSAPNITAFHFRESVALVSGQCRVPQWPGTTKLSRSFGGQRGHVGRPVFLIELRCALWASPPSITAFGLPALSCQSVRAALLRPAQVPGSYIASASQVLVSALWRRIWPRLACASCWISHRLRLGLAAVVFVAVVAHARYGHPLRFYITPHCPQCPPVAALKLRLVPVTAARPIG